MEQFSLEKYLENPTRKVVTRNGKTVRIVCWDKLGEYPIVGCVKYSDDYEDLESYDINGFKYSFDREDQNDLFFADEEKELTEFEKAIKKLIESCCNEVEEANITNAGAKEISSHILDFARKELKKEFKDEEYFRLITEHYKQGKKEALKSLPRWKKATEHKEFAVHVCVMDEDMYLYLDTEVNEGEHYIELSDLKTLPKE